MKKNRTITGLLAVIGGLGLMGAALCGCAGSGATPRTGDDATVAVAGDQYDTTFNAARQVLRDRGFILERVDAQEGVITTRPKTTAGVLTPWDREQQTLSQEFEDLFERQQRVVRISFEPETGLAAVEDGAATTPPPVPAGDRTMHVQVTVQRVHLPGRRLEPEAVSQTSYSWDPVLGERGMQPGYAVAYKGDRALAERLAGLIEEQAMRGVSVAEIAEEPMREALAEPAAESPTSPSPTPVEAAQPAPVEPPMTPAAVEPAVAPVSPPPPPPLPPPPPPPPANPWVEGKPLKKS